MKKCLFILALLPFLCAAQMEEIGGEFVTLDISKSVNTEELSDANFYQKIASGYSIVDFYAVWCGPCRSYSPKFEKVAEEMQGVLSFYKVNVDITYLNDQNVRAIPTTILYKEGVEVKRITGNISEEALRQFIQNGMSQ